MTDGYSFSATSGRHASTPAAAGHADGHPDGLPDSAAAELAVLRTEVAQLRRALASQPTIDQAKGMLMLRYALGPETAFVVLKRLSQDHNVKLRDIAQAMVHAVDGTHSGAASPPSPTAVIADNLLAGNPDGLSAAEQQL